MSLHDLRAKMGSNAGSSFAPWPNPTPLPSGLPPVQSFNAALLPTAFRGWISDIADRMQCPPDYIGVAAMVAAGSLIGRRVGIRPQAKTDWTEVGNLWGAIVGPPGVMKTPAMKEALKPLYRLEAKASEEYEAAIAEHRLAEDVVKLEREEAGKKARERIRIGDNEGARRALKVPDPEAPQRRRYIVNDATVEALGVVLSANPNGVLIHRDEMASLMRSLESEESAEARGFYLSGWTGTGGYDFDRIMRGLCRVPSCTVSMLGTIQPGRIGDMLRRSVQGSASDDGLVQRLQLMVWPDLAPAWHDVDRYPNVEARDRAYACFDRLANLTAEQAGAEVDPYSDIPFLRFDDEALEVFRDWRAGLEARVRSTDDLHPAFVAHLSKYRGLAPRLALVCHLASDGVGPVGKVPLAQALSWIEYLETHAARAYASVAQSEVGAARTILKRIRAGDLIGPFSARDIHQRDWSGLTDRERVQRGLDMLEDHDVLRLERMQTGGRPRDLYHVNPKVLA